MFVVPVEAPAEIPATLGLVRYFAEKLTEEVEFIFVASPDDHSAGDIDELIDHIDAVAEHGAIRPSLRLVLTERAATEAMVDACRDRFTLMRTHATPFLGDTFVGSHAAALLAVTTAPVILIGPNVDGAVAPIVDEIAIALGGEIEEIELFHHARSLANAIGVTTRQVHVMVPNDEHVLVGDGGDSRFWYPGSARASLPVDPIDRGEVGLGRQLAASMPRSMLAMTTHARRGLNRIAEGSITFDAVEASLQPVLAIGPAAGLAGHADRDQAPVTVVASRASCHQAVASRDSRLLTTEIMYRPG